MDLKTMEVEVTRLKAKLFDYIEGRVELEKMIGTRDEVLRDIVNIIFDVDESVQEISYHDILNKIADLKSESDRFHEVTEADVQPEAPPMPMPSPETVDLEQYDTEYHDAVIDQYDTE